MYARLIFFLRIGIFWIAYHFLSRGIFLAYNHDYSSSLSPAELALTFLHGIKMDLSITGYILLLTGLLLSVSILKPGTWVHRTFSVLNVFLLLFFSGIVMVDLELYRHWGFRMNTTPLMYVGSEAVGSVSPTVMIELLLVLALLFGGAVWAYMKLVAPAGKSFPEVPKRNAVAFLVLAVLMILPIRGSFSVAPMNSGFVYFHKTKMYANHAAVNVVWNFLYSLEKISTTVYPEDFFPHDRATRLIDSLYHDEGKTIPVLNSSRPNIMLFIVESFTADVIAPLGGLPDVTPNLNALAREGVLFDNFYASGDRTDKGLISVLSAYPAQPRSTIIKEPSKTQHLSYLTHSLKKLGYRTSFIYGGDIDFANFRSYLTNAAFDDITSDEDFPDEWNESKWGVHDHLVMERALLELDTATQPFFKTMLTLSSHEPFDVPMQPVFKGTSNEMLFINSCHYTDKCIGDFIRTAKTKSWWSNTIVIFVADHGARHPGNKPLQDKARYKIPLLMIGGAIRRDTVVHTYGSQTDIANTILAQIDKPNPSFNFSRNLLSTEARSFAAFFYNDGYGFLTPDHTITFDNTGNRFILQQPVPQHVLDVSKALEQALFSDYNKR